MNRTFFILSISLVSAALATIAHGKAPDPETPAGWYASGQEEIAQRRARYKPASARNIILIIGDGMSVGTITAARILAGQQAGGSGEGHTLAFESFPYTALAKTYNTNQQTPDSAGTMTAMATGVKSFAGAIAVDQRAERSDCRSSQGRELVSLVDLAKQAGMAAGIVTTTRITHATPAVLFAKSPERSWESDGGLAPSAREAGCRDIARQLVEYDIGGGLDVVLGGGRSAFLPSETTDPEYPDQRGRRQDRTNLVEQWQQTHNGAVFAWNLEQFNAIDDDPEGPVLGLFEPSHMQYEHDRTDEPSLAEMTRKAIRILENRKTDGYVLIIEGGRIDHAHHAGNAYRALTDAIALSDAVAVAAEMTDAGDTLIAVTADHGHALTFGGYPSRGNPILGLVRGPGPDGEGPRLARDIDGKPYTTINYINGPGYRPGPRPDYEDENIDPEDPDFRQEAVVGFSSSTHTGEDVPVYARGPGAEVMHGSIEQHLVFHALLQAQPKLNDLARATRGQDGFPDWQTLLDLAQAESAGDESEEDGSEEDGSEEVKLTGDESEAAEAAP